MRPGAHEESDLSRIDRRARERAARSSPLTGAAVALLAFAVLTAGPLPALAADPSGAPSASSSPAPSPDPAPPSPSAPASPSTPPASSAPPSPSATPTAPPLPDGVTPLPASVTFAGRGYGHGVGLSQYGARGRALAGQAASAIVAHYYPGTTPSTISASTPVRVQLLYGWKATSAAPLVVYGRGGTWSIDGLATVFPADARLSLTPVVVANPGSATGVSVSWRLRVTSADGSLLHEDTRRASFRMRATTSATSFELRAKPTSRNRFRGVLRILPRLDAATLSAANELGLDLYLRGVVPVEMPSTWPTEALRAQAIVARSYAARALRPGVSWFDVYDDTRSQSYHGRLGERAATNLAITATAGQILRSGSAIANTVFHSTAGGHTEHNENVFVSSSGAKVAGAVAYLRGRPDLAADGSAYDAAAPYARWTSGTWSAAQLSAFLAADARTNVGTVLGLDLRQRGVSGRLISVTIHGTSGVKRVSGDVFRSVVNTRKPGTSASIRSNLFELVLPAPAPDPVP